MANVWPEVVPMSCERVTGVKPKVKRRVIDYENNRHIHAAHYSSSVSKNDGERNCKTVTAYPKRLSRSSSSFPHSRIGWPNHDVQMTVMQSIQRHQWNTRRTHGKCVLTNAQSSNKKNVFLFWFHLHTDLDGGVARSHATAEASLHLPL